MSGVYRTEMSQINYTTLTNNPLNVSLVDPSGSALTVVSSRLGVDVLTSGNNNVTTEDVDHHYLHAGLSFSVVGYDSIASSATYDIVLSIPASPHIHMQWGFSSSLSANLNIYEDASATSGTSITAFNRDRNSATTPTVTLVANPVVVIVGTKITAHSLENGRREGGEIAGREWNLKSGSKYLVRVFSTAAQAGIFDYEFRWLEYTE